MSSYTKFEDQFLVACALEAENTEDDVVNVDAVLSKFNLSASDNYISRAVIGFYDRKFTRHTPWVGDFTNRNIQLSAQGIREADKLIKFGIEARDENFEKYTNVVDVSKNLTVVNDVRNALAEVSDLIRSNESSIVLGEQLVPVQADISASEQMVSRSKFSITSLKSLVMPVMHFIIDKFASGALAEAAKKVVEAIMRLF